jgi:DNA-binding transcriptional LysR family regulator
VDGIDLLCYWAVQELGWSVTGLAKPIVISPPPVSYAIQREEPLVREKGLQSVPK